MAVARRSISACLHLGAVALTMAGFAAWVLAAERADPALKLNFAVAMTIHVAAATALALIARYRPLPSALAGMALVILWAGLAVEASNDAGFAVGIAALIIAGRGVWIAWRENRMRNAE